VVRWSSLRLPIAITTLIIPTLFALGMAAGYSLYQYRASGLQAQVHVQENRIFHLETQALEKQTEIDKFYSDVSVFKTEVVELTAELGYVEQFLTEQESMTEKAELESLELSDLVGELQLEVEQLKLENKRYSESHDELKPLRASLGPVESDRFLLIELRKDLPGTRRGALLHWENLKRLAIDVDPALGPKADRVLRLLPTYFDWYEQEYESLVARLEEYFNTGAVDFDTVSSDFEKSALLAVIDDLDLVVSFAE